MDVITAICVLAAAIILAGWWVSDAIHDFTKVYERANIPPEEEEESDER